MGRSATLALLMVLGLSTTGCGFINSFLNRDSGTESTEPADADDTEVATGDTDTEAAEGTDGAEQAEGQDEGAQLFEEAMLPGLPSAAEIALAELLPSTDPNERLKEVDNDRPDPYAFVPIPPPPSAAPPAPEDTPEANVEEVDDANEGTNGGAGEPESEAAEQPDGDFLPLEPLPALPEPAVVASQVQIFGIAQVRGEVYAIVLAPNEPTSRYVREGDRLANGTVLVKRIETRTSSEPLVVLEERGIEIALPVGAGGGEPEEPTAALQTPQSSPEIATLPLPSLEN